MNDIKKELDFIKTAAENVDISLNEESLDLFSKYTDTLLSWNKVMNLTAITDIHDIVIKHYYDSIYPLSDKLIKDSESVIDVGCGAGMPGLPLKFALSTIKLTLLDSLNKRVNFINSFLSEVKLNDVNVICGRAEDIALKDEYRESYDVAVSRAVAQLRVLCEYCIPYIKLGGKFLAYKGKSASKELKDSENAVKLLGCEVEDIKEVKFPNENLNHAIVIIRKIKHTPSQYPRKMAKISKHPL